jgi:putative flippase GtrA
MMETSTEEMKEFERVIRFLMTGVLNTLVGYMIFAALYFVGFDKFFAIAAATALGALFNFFSIGELVFRQSKLTLLPRFLCVYVGQCGVNMVGMHLVSNMHFTPYLAQLILVPGLATGTYLALRSFVFRGEFPAEDPVR